MTGHLIQAIVAIKEGILSDDMQKVIEGFELLTGESLEINETKTKTEPQKTEDNEFIADIKKSPQRGKSVQNPNRVNKFEDDGSHTVEEAGYDAVHDEVKPVARQRASFKTIEQKCHVCGKAEEVHPLHKREYFKCRKCIAR